MFQRNCSPPKIIEISTLPIVVPVGGATRQFIATGIKQGSSYQQYLETFRNMLPAAGRAHYHLLIAPGMHTLACRLQGLDPTGIRVFHHRYGAAMSASYTRTTQEREQRRDILSKR